MLWCTATLSHGIACFHCEIPACYSSCFPDSFQTIPQCKYSPGKVAFESLFGEAISAFDSKFGKKIGDEGQKCFCLVFFFGRFWKIQK